MFFFFRGAICLGSIQKLQETSQNLSQIAILVLMLLQIVYYCKSIYNPGPFSNNEKNNTGEQLSYESNKA